MKKVREAPEDGPAQEAEGSEGQEGVPLREREATLSREGIRFRAGEVGRRTTGGRGQDEGDVETRARGRATSAERTIGDAIAPIWRSEGWVMLEDGPRQDEEVTRPIANAPGQTE
jgi:hypothetical protein